MHEQSTTQSARRAEGCLGSDMHTQRTERHDRGHGISEFLFEGGERRDDYASTDQG